MNDRDLISALGALEQRAKIATRKVEYSSALYRLQRKVEELEERLNNIENARK